MAKDRKSTFSATGDWFNKPQCVRVMECYVSIKGIRRVSTYSIIYRYNI